MHFELNDFILNTKKRKNDACKKPGATRGLNSSKPPTCKLASVLSLMIENTFLSYRVLVENDLDEFKFRGTHPTLTAWANRVAERPSLKELLPHLAE